MTDLQSVHVRLDARTIAATQMCWGVHCYLVAASAPVIPHTAGDDEVAAHRCYLLSLVTDACSILPTCALLPWPVCYIHYICIHSVTAADGMTSIYIAWLV